MKTKNVLIILTTAVIILAGILSSFGLFFLEFYSKETVSWQVQSAGQDIINLVLVLPFLSITTLLVLKGVKYSEQLWAGGILYLVYTYTIYCFNIHFNRLFIGYCFVMGTCAYLFIYFLLQQAHTVKSKQNQSMIGKVTGIFFLFISSAFYLLWLKDIIPYLHPGAVPADLSDTGLFTNPVRVLDLSLFLPGIFMTGILLVRKKAFGFMLAPVVLSFMILMNMTIAGLTTIMHANGTGTSLSVVLIMSILSLICLALLFFNLKHQSYESSE